MFLSIDAGTSQIKAALMDIDGNQIDFESSQVKLSTPFEGACEIDMNGLWRTLCTITSALKMRNEEIWNTIIGIGIAAQGDGLWAIDKKGEPVRNAILWNDTRTKTLKIQDGQYLDDVCVKNCTNVAYAGSVHMLLRWLLENEKDSMNSISYVLHCKDWLNFKLTGEISTDYSDASLAVMNLFKKEYSIEVLDALGVGKYKKYLPKPVQTTQIIGKVNKRGSSESGIREGVPVIAGALDVAAVALGAGLKDTGDACSIVGTTLCNQLVHENQHIDFTRGLVLCPIPNDTYITAMPTLNGTSTIDWAKDILAPGISFKEIEEKLENIPLGSRGIICHPYIHGERSPFRNPYACGGFYGLTSVHTKLDMLRAIYEGVAYSMYDCYKYFPPIFEQVYVSGGGSVSGFICQMFSDCLGKVILRSSVKQQGIYGMYCALKVALGLEHDFSGINIKIRDKFEPDMDKHEKYLHQFNKYKDLGTSMENFWRERHS